MTNLADVTVAGANVQPFGLRAEFVETNPPIFPAILHDKGSRSFLLLATLIASVHVAAIRLAHRSMISR